MNKVDLIPFNLDLLIPDEELKKKLKRVGVLDIFIPSSKDFHPEGLFSVNIFGPVGSEARMRNFAYIDLKCEVFHPLIYRVLGDLKALYKDIMSSTSYAVWDDALKDFVKSDALSGDTGFTFFMQYIDKLKPEMNDSNKRKFSIELFDRYRSKYKTNSCIVLQAGLRDYTVDDDGKPTEDEVNKLYRRLLSLSGLINEDAFKLSPKNYDVTRYNIQRVMLEIYEYFESMLEGKSKFIQGKWVSRKTFNTTRNVISSLSDVSESDTVGFNETVIGLHQYLRVLVPKSIYLIRNKVLNKVFPSNDSIGYLINSKTLKKEEVALDADVFDTWTSPEGIESLVIRFGNLDMRHSDIRVTKTHYLALVYNDGKRVAVVHDIDDLPEGFSRDHVKPMTYAELFYLSVYETDKTIPALVTRYPVTVYGSIYPTYMYLRTTTPGLDVEILDENFNSIQHVSNYPKHGQPFFNTMSVHYSHIDRLNADHDGDALSLQALLSEEADEEVKEKLGNKSYYVNDSGNMNFSMSNVVLDVIFETLTE